MQYVVLFVVVFLVLKACSGDPSPEQLKSDREWNIRFAAENAVRQKLKDPDSAKFDYIHVRDNVACGSVNAKNSFGAYAGGERFVSAGTLSSTFLESEVKKKDFQEIWQIKC